MAASLPLWHDKSSLGSRNNLKKAKPKSKPKSMDSVLRKKRRVFILGAGASASCAIAVARDILRVSMQRLAKRNAAKATRIHDLMHYLYSGFDETLSNYPNVEDFLNMLEMTKTFHTEAFIESKRWSAARLQEVMDITLRAITEYIWDFMADEDRRRVLAGLVHELVRPGDVIISFNWDFMIDLALEDDQRDFSLAYRYPRPVIQSYC